MPTSEYEMPGAPDEQCGPVSTAQVQSAAEAAVAAFAAAAAPAESEDTPQMAHAQAVPAVLETQQDSP
eukprot:7723390-Lingulodinium_polyedra.AAC.1